MHPVLTDRPSRHRQSGVSLIFALITLIALMMGALALVRNTDTASLLLGNLGFKQDATLSADQATRIAISWLNANSAGLNADMATDGYYASNKEYSTDGTTRVGPIDITGAQSSSDTSRQLIDWDNNNCSAAAASSYATCSIKPKAITETINHNSASYVILRMCNKAGDYTTDSTIVCLKPLTSSSDGATGRGELNYSEYARFGSTAQTYFRVLVRMQGQRGATSYTETIVHF
ncbi:MAG: pilus assembly protein PilX [Acidobacteriota bacterium]